MDNLEIYVPPQCNEECFDMVTPFEKEEVSRYQLPNAPLLNAACMNMGDSFPVTEKVPPFSTSIPLVNKPAFAFNFLSYPSIGSNVSAPLYNRQNHVPRSSISPGFKLNGTFAVRNQPVSVFSSASIYRNPLDIDLSRKRKSLFSSTSTPSFGSITPGNYPTHDHSSVISSVRQPNIYMPKKRQSDHIFTPPNTSQFCCESIARKLAYNPRLGCISFVGPSVFFSEVNQQISYSSFANSPLCDSHGCLTSRDQLDLNLAMTSTPHTSRNDFRSLSEVPQRSLPNRFIGQISSPIFPINHDTYKTCSECGKKFPTFHALGGHISAHAKARKKLAKMTGLVYAYDKASSIVLHDFGDGSSATPNASIVTSAATYEKVEGFKYSNVVEEGFSTSLVEEFGLEKFSSSEEIVRKDSSISSNKAIFISRINNGESFISTLQDLDKLLSCNVKN